MELMIWRHAEAVEKRDELPDLERMLSRRGQKQAARIGAWLAARLPGDTRVLCSPALRCQQTALALGRRTEICAQLAPDVQAADILEAAGWPGGRHPVLLVGHQPALGEVLARVLAIEGGHCAIDKGAVWWLRRGEVDGRAQIMLRTVQSPELV